jgi:hypothetical protein
MQGGLRATDMGRGTRVLLVAAVVVFLFLIGLGVRFFRWQDMNYAFAPKSVSTISHSTWVPGLGRKKTMTDSILCSGLETPKQSGPYLWMLWFNVVH